MDDVAGELADSLPESADGMMGDEDMVCLAKSLEITVSGKYVLLKMLDSTSLRINSIQFNSRSTELGPTVMYFFR